jgi:flagellin-like protein
MRNKKGLSPVIATVLLISLVIVLGSMVFLWFRGIVEEPIEKDLGGGGENVKMICNDVKFQAEYVGNRLQITNTGNVPIFDMKLIIDKVGTQETTTLRTLMKDEDVGWEKTGLNSGGVFSDSVIIDGDATQVTIVPILLGETSEGREAHPCDKSVGYKITNI